MSLGKHGTLYTWALSKTEVWTRHRTCGRSTARGKGLPPVLREMLRTSMGDMRALSRASGERPSGAHGQDKPSPDENLGHTILSVLSLVKRKARWKWGVFVMPGCLWSHPAAGWLSSLHICCRAAVLGALHHPPKESLLTFFHVESCLFCTSCLTLS